jgi:hypothetical protein
MIQLGPCLVAGMALCLDRIWHRRAIHRMLIPVLLQSLHVRLLVGQEMRHERLPYLFWYLE